MKTTFSGLKDAQIEIVGYSDNVWNLKIITDDDKHHRLEITQHQAIDLCDMLGVEFPNPDPEPL